MSRPQEGSPAGPQDPQNPAGVSGPDVPGPGEAGSSGRVTGATSSSVQDQPGSRGQTSASHASGTSASSGAGKSGTPKHRAARASKQTSTRGGVTAIVAGLLGFLVGLAVVVRTSFYPTLPNYAYRASNLHIWGWVLFGLGVLLFAAGTSHLLGMAWARAVGVGLASLLAIAAFMFLPYAPIFGVILVALSVFTIWAMLNPDTEGDSPPSRAIESDTTTSHSMRV